MCSRPKCPNRTTPAWLDNGSGNSCKRQNVRGVEPMGNGVAKGCTCTGTESQGRWQAAGVVLLIECWDCIGMMTDGESEVRDER